jgi:hypothetical protein
MVVENPECLDYLVTWYYPRYPTSGGVIWLKPAIVRYAGFQMPNAGLFLVS